MIGGRRPVTGRKPGDRRVQVDRPHTAYFRYTGPNQLVAKPAASQARTPLGRTLTRWKAWLIGRPLANAEEAEERLSKRLALPIFSSDAISSSAYATEEILRVLVIGGAAAFLLSVEVAAAIAIMLAVVALSYRQVCRAFPNGGGAYAVARKELSPLLGLVAASALLIDYVMTVAVSTSSAVEQLISIAPQINDFRVEIAILSITLITIANLRGLRESGNIFAIPTYLFVGLALTIIAIDFFRIVTGQVLTPPPHAEAMELGTETIGVFLVLKAFASGSVALTGTEAVANGVPAFKPPESKNAANTLVVMAVLLAVLFVGITVIADAYQIVPSEEGSGGPTVIALVAQTAFGAGSPMFYTVPGRDGADPVPGREHRVQRVPQARRAARRRRLHAAPVLVPRRPARVLVGDRPAVRRRDRADHLLRRRDDTAHPALLGRRVRLLHAEPGRHGAPLAAEQGAGWQRRAAINAIGAVMTGVVLVVVASVKFTSGAYLVVILIPTLVGIMLFIHRQYAASSAALAVRPDFVASEPARQERAIVPVPGINRAVIQAVNVARSITSDVTAVYISDDDESSTEMRALWERHVPGVALVIVQSPYRALAGPLAAYLDVLERAWPPDKPDPITFIVVPEYVAQHWWERILYNQSARHLRSMLLGRQHTVVVDVPYRRDDPMPDEPARRWSPRQ